MQDTIRLVGILLFFIVGSPFQGISGGSGLMDIPQTLTGTSGHRIDVTNIEIIKVKSKSFQIYVDVVNTGRFDIVMGKEKRLPYLEVGFDESLEAANLTEHRDAIRKKLLEQNIKIKIGETKKRVFLKVKTNKKAMSAPNYSVTPPVTRETAVKERKMEVAEKNKQSKSRTKKKTKSKGSNESGFFLPTFKEKSLDDIIAEKEACPDLIIESARIIKANSKKATLEYVVKNIGKGDAQLYDNSKKDDNPIAIRAYISGTPELSKGSFAIDGNFITQGAGIIRGILSPDQSMTVSAELDIRRKTRYMPIIILAVDPFLKLPECDRTNNTNHVVLD